MRLAGGIARSLFPAPPFYRCDWFVPLSAIEGWGRRTVFADPNFASNDRRLGVNILAESAILGLLPHAPGAADDSTGSAHLPAPPSDRTSLTRATETFASRSPTPARVADVPD